MDIDLDSLKARLAEYDPAAPKCFKKIKVPDGHVYNDDEDDEGQAVYRYDPCCRPEGHSGNCTNTRSVLGWPGYQIISAMVSEIETLREKISDFEDDFRKVVSDNCAPDEKHCSCVPHLRQENSRLREGLIELNSAVSRIDYAFETPNEMGLSSYDVHANPEAVVERVENFVKGSKTE